MQWSPEDAAVRRFFETGWEEVETLGRGARGPVVSIRRADGRGPISALKRSTHHEVEALKALSNCRNIVELEEIFLCSGQVLARLECMEGGSFRSYLRARPPGRVSEDVVRYVVGQVLEGLQDMHQSGWMHRDVKAENIGLGCELSSWGYRDCTVKLLDFDVAVEVGCGGLSEVIGTVENMAPEVFKGSYNELADIWSVGIITYEALYGYRPFNDANVDRIEEMVRNWQRYLLFPFDAAELPAHFIRLMLADPEERAAAGTVRHHRWLRPGHIESELPATGSGFPNSYRHHPSSKSEGSKVKLHEANCRSRSVKVSTVKLLEGLRDEPKDEIETSFTEWDQDSPSGQAVETLSRLRQGLSMWTNSRFAMVDGTDAADLGQQLGEGAGTSCSLPTRHASRFIPLKSECAEFRTERVPERGARHTDVTGSEAKTESLEDLEASSMVEDDTRDPSADQWHQSYLQRIRERTKEVLHAAAQLKASEAAPRDEVRQAPPRSSRPAPTPMHEEDLNTPEETWDRQKSDEREARHANLASADQSEFNRQLSPSQSLPHVPHIPREEKRQDTEVVSLQHLKSAKTRAQELLQILSQASRAPRSTELRAEGLTPTPPPRPPVKPAPRRPASHAPERVVAAIASAVDTGSGSAEASPLSWLACQKHRMDRLLLGLQSASEDITVASGS